MTTYIEPTGDVLVLRCGEVFYHNGSARPEHWESVQTTVAVTWEWISQEPTKVYALLGHMGAVPVPPEFEPGDRERVLEQMADDHETYETPDVWVDTPDDAPAYSDMFPWTPVDPVHNVFNRDAVTAAIREHYLRGAASEEDAAAAAAEIAGVVMALARDEREVKAEALTELADEMEREGSGYALRSIIRDRADTIRTGGAS